MAMSRMPRRCSKIRWTGKWLQPTQLEDRHPEVDRLEAHQCNKSQILCRFTFTWTAWTAMFVQMEEEKAQFYLLCTGAKFTSPTKSAGTALQMRQLGSKSLLLALTETAVQWSSCGQGTESVYLDFLRVQMKMPQQCKYCNAMTGRKEAEIPRRRSDSWCTLWRLPASLQTPLVNFLNRFFLH